MKNINDILDKLETSKDTDYVEVAIIIRDLFAKINSLECKNKLMNTTIQELEEQIFMYNNRRCG